MEQMLEQLKRRIEGNRKATSRAADIFMSMVDRSLLRQLRINTQEELETDQLEQELARQGVFFRQIQLEGDWWRHTTGKLLAFLREDDTPVVLPSGSPSLYLIKQVRDESHRFAITYHRELRTKAQGVSVLDEVAGVGPKRKRAIMRHFGSFKRLRAANPEQIAEVKGVPAHVAEEIWRELRAWDEEREVVAKKA